MKERECARSAGQYDKAFLPTLQHPLDAPTVRVVGAAQIRVVDDHAAPRGWLVHHRDGDLAAVKVVWRMGSWER